MDCLHLKTRFRNKEEGWVCQACNAKIELTSRWKSDDGVPLMSMPHDVDNIDPKYLRNSNTLRAAGITKGAKQEQVYSGLINDARSAYKPVDKVKAHYKIPQEVYFARQKEDKKYWDNPDNVARYKDMKIS
jgi:hypothetical protein